MADRSIRASDDDRERVVAVLRDQTAQGRLTMDEFEERMDAAYAATTWDDLRTLTADLPVEVAFDGNGARVEGTKSTAPHARDRSASPGIDRRWAFALPALAVLSVFVLVAIASGSARSVAPLLFIGLFWGLCAQGCRSRSTRDRHRPPTRRM